ncbi:hypothetical protein HN371_03870 [Candidatus Poribacteria bacterium]|jgi:hypothetical protein|nr:hypothetical protein [Candidatus Poribacteria bacterium]MBT5534545.1 hypothetical protein [Candidatus Poribacteria bacterium]MBT5710145.1 hypothetical protein [Candidatus Poribacteria bacterium]MBT7098229.1 hypothetical protein [Candidatus Poribacteria bacterium]MBT7805701.1 hypothetical protein [Candidatus Poribacteria bacterium]
MDSARGNRGPLRFSAYVPAQEVTTHLSHADGRARALAHFRASHISRVYLDCLRGGHTPDAAVLSTARDHLNANGIDVAAGLTPTRGSGRGSTHGRHWLCYTSADTRRELAEVSRFTARLFDHIIVDDFLCTQCQCAECVDERGDGSWEEYYGELMARVARECFIDPIKAENADATVIIKYPQWYDRFHNFGYDVTRHPTSFDEVWAGTEIRDPLVEYVVQYQAFANHTWLGSLSGDRMGGAWFDFINCYPEIYVEQAVQSILAGAREMIRFHYGPDLYEDDSPCTAALIEAIPTLTRLAEELDGQAPEGVLFVKPPMSDAGDEAYLADTLGMLGLPIIPTHVLAASAEAVCLAAHAASEPDIVARALALAERGATVLLTPGFIRRLAHDARVLDMAGLAYPGAVPCDLWTFRFAVDGRAVSGEQHVRFASRLLPTTADVLATAIHADGPIPVLTRRSVGEGQVVVLNAATFEYPPGSGRVTSAEPVSLTGLPQPLADRLRALMLSGSSLDVDVRSKVGVYRYGDRLVLTNFNDQDVSARVRGVAAEALVTYPPDRLDVGPGADGETLVTVPCRGFCVLRVTA